MALEPNRNPSAKMATPPSGNDSGASRSSGDVSSKSMPASAAATFLGVCGGVVFASALLFAAMFPDASAWLSTFPLGMSTLALAVWGWLSRHRLRAKFSERSGVFLLVTVGMSVAWLTVLGALQFLVAQSPVHWDLTAQRVHSLSEQSLKLLQGLREPVRVTAFYERDRPERAKLEELFVQYQKHSPQIELRIYSPTTHVEEAQRFDVADDGPRVFVETRWEKASERRVSRYAVDLQDWRHEEAFTNALMKTLQPERPRIYLLTGHGEVEGGDKSPVGYQQSVSALIDEGYDVLELNLIQRKQIPDDAKAVLIVAPAQSFLPPEVALLSDYLKRGGRAAFFLEPNVEAGLSSLLGMYGVQLNDDVVIDLSPFGSMFGGGPDTAIAVDYAKHAITEKFKGAATVFPRARSLSINPGTRATVVPLVWTGERAWGETQMMEGSELEWNEGEVRGPVTLALGIEQGFDVSGAQTEPRTDSKDVLLRMLVVGDASFASNQYLSMSANRNLFLNSVAWLSDQDEKIAIRPRTRGSNQIVLSPGQREGIAFFVLYGLPVSLLSIGLAIWLVRRQR